jgi:hypothetical protein
METTMARTESMRKPRSCEGFAEKASILSCVSTEPDDSYLQEENIAVAAYFLAQQRGFAPGNELADWFHAEVELRNRSIQAGS